MMRDIELAMLIVTRRTSSRKAQLFFGKYPAVPDAIVTPLASVVGENWGNGGTSVRARKLGDVQKTILERFPKLDVYVRKQTYADWWSVGNRAYTCGPYRSMAMCACCVRSALGRKTKLYVCSSFLCHATVGGNPATCPLRSRYCPSVPFCRRLVVLRAGLSLSPEDERLGIRWTRAATPFQGPAFRPVELRHMHPDDALSGAGAAKMGGRFVPVCTRAIYAADSE